MLFLAGTPRGDLYPCDIGTFSNMTGLNSSGQCADCLAGHYCETAGLSYPTGLCDAGYYCKLGAESAAPTQGANADKCPQGSYACRLSVPLLYLLVYLVQLRSFNCHSFCPTNLAQNSQV